MLLNFSIFCSKSNFSLEDSLEENFDEERIRNGIVQKGEKKVRTGMVAHRKEDIPQKPARGMVVRIEQYFAKKREISEKIKNLRKEKVDVNYVRAIGINQEIDRLNVELEEIRGSLKCLDSAICSWAEKWRRENSDAHFEEGSFKRNWIGALKAFRHFGLEELVAMINSDARDGSKRKKMHKSRFVSAFMKFFSRPFVPAATAKKTSRNRMIRRLRKRGFDFTYARERELIGDDDETTQNYYRVFSDVDEIGDLDKPHRNMSLKLTSIGLATFDGEIDDLDKMPQLNKNLIKAGLKAIVRKAQEKDVFVRIDMEHFIFKDVTFEIFLETLEELAQEEQVFGRGPSRGDKTSICDHLGMVFQAYLNESPEDAEKIIDRADRLHDRYGIKVRLRLVKGANRGKDKKLQENGLHKFLKKTWHGRDRTLDQAKWDKFQKVSPIAGAEDKDAERGRVKSGGQFVDIMRKLERAKSLVVDYGTHNPNTIAQIKAEWLNLGRMPDERQIQFLMGVDNSLKFVLDELGFNQRVYVPFEQIELVAEYLWRRFVEYLGESTKPSIERKRDENGKDQWVKVDPPEVDMAV